MSDVYKTHDEKTAYDEGWAAFWDQAQKSGNPYHLGGRSWELWLLGWEDASIDFGACVITEDEVLMGKLLPRLPLSRQYAKVTLQFRGMGKPRFGFECEDSQATDSK